MTTKKDDVATAQNATVQIPAITACHRIPQQAIKDAVNQIIRNFQPQRIILFGSYAYGHPRQESDVDLLVVMDTHRTEAEQAVHICQEIDYHFGLDLIVRTPANMSRRLVLGDPCLNEVVSKGKVLYERTHG